jgi:protein tyrosine/serine phosphatase
VLWEEYFKDRVIPNRWMAVEEGKIYRSGRLSEALVERTPRKHGIQVVIDLTGTEPEDVDQRAEIAACEKLNIERYQFPLGGHANGDVENYIGAVLRLQQTVQSGQTVLVHCAAGTERTGSVLATYRILVEQDNPAQVYQDTVDAGWKPDKNPILENYLNENLEQVAQRLASQGAIARVPDPLPVFRR